MEEHKHLIKLTEVISIADIPLCFPLFLQDFIKPCDRRRDQVLLPLLNVQSHNDDPHRLSGSTLY